MMSKRYQPLTINLIMGTKYLINESAYFLGGIFAANESVVKDGVRYWVAPVRHNKQFVKAAELELHYEQVKFIAAKLAKETFMAKTIRINGLDTGKFKGRVGFGTFFEANSDALRLEDDISALQNALAASPQTVRRCFLVGMFDGRGVIAFDYRKNAILFIALRCETQSLREFLCHILEDECIDYRLFCGRGGKTEIRISRWQQFMELIGWISPKKFSVIRSAVAADQYQIKEEDDILKGLKTLQKKEER